MSQNREIIALVDDDPIAAGTLSVLLEDAGYEAVEVESPLESIESAIAQISRVATAAVCDHRLSPRGLAHFSGAELVAQLYAIKFPAVLISQFLRLTRMYQYGSIEAESRFCLRGTKQVQINLLMLSESVQMRLVDNFCHNERAGVL